jgi:uncharacterized glyoxalase superfamily metalloenzyme YdcJ
VHSTAFRPVGDASLKRNPFRVFTSLLRLDLIADETLRTEAAKVLAGRNIFTEGAVALIEKAERNGGLDREDAARFVAEVLETFRWHDKAIVDAGMYRRLHDAHRLIADVVSFRGPHINHLTPRTLDIDRVQKLMPEHGIAPKAVVEGPPTRACPILLRQTSFKALEEAVSFRGADGSWQAGSHTARFGEIEQRGVALTRKGRALYDRLLAQVRDMGSAGSAAPDYGSRLAQVFEAFPDTHEQLRRQDLAFYRFTLSEEGSALAAGEAAAAAASDLDALVTRGLVHAEPIVYEDFLPVSAAGIFQSNLGGEEQKQYAAHAAQQAFEGDLGARVHDEIALYEQAQQRSIDQLRGALRAQAARVAA